MGVGQRGVGANIGNNIWVKDLVSKDFALTNFDLKFGPNLVGSKTSDTKAIFP